MLPRGLSDESLRERLLAWEDLPSIVEWKIDRTNYRPKMWLATGGPVLLGPVKSDLFDDPIVMLPSARPPRQARDLGQGGADKQVEEVLAKGAWRTLFTPTKAVEKMLESFPQPAEDPRSVLRRAERRKQRPYSRGEKKAKKTKKDKAPNRAERNKMSQSDGSPDAGEAVGEVKVATREELKLAEDEKEPEKPVSGAPGKTPKVLSRPRGQKRRKARKASNPPIRAEGYRPITDWTIAVQGRNQELAGVDDDSSAVSDMDGKQQDPPRRVEKRLPMNSGSGSPSKKHHRQARKSARPAPYGQWALPGHVRGTDIIAPQQSASHDHFVSTMRKQ